MQNQYQSDASKPPAQATNPITILSDKVRSANNGKPKGIITGHKSDKIIER